MKVVFILSILMVVVIAQVLIC